MQGSDALVMAGVQGEDQGALLSATLRFVEHGHILAEQRQVSARWSRGHE